MTAKTKCKVEVLHYTPIHIAAHAIRECHNSHDKSDTNYDISNGLEVNIGPKDKKLIHRIGNKMKHASTLEHLSVSLSISGISRALLQEWSRSRMMSQTVRSSRYTLGALKDEEPFAIDSIMEAEDGHERGKEYLFYTGNLEVDMASLFALENLRVLVKSGVLNDVSKYALPDSFLTSLTATINIRSLQNMLSLRSAPSALAEYRDLTHAIYDALPSDYQELVEHCLAENQM